MPEKKKKINLEAIEKYKFEISKELGIADKTNLEGPDKLKDDMSSQGRNAFFDSLGEDI